MRVFGNIKTDFLYFSLFSRQKGSKYNVLSRSHYLWYAVSIIFSEHPSYSTRYHSRLQSDQDIIFQHVVAWLHLHTVKLFLTTVLTYLLRTGLLQQVRQRLASILIPSYNCYFLVITENKKAI